MELAALLLLIFFLVLGIRAARRNKKLQLQIREEPQREAGRAGEKLVQNWLARILHEDDTLLTNVSITYDGKPTECDNIIVNSSGVFILEVKNYVGTLYGEENDFEWTKEKTTKAGRTFEKTVTNPIRQVKRQIYILKNFLSDCGASVWVEGYAFLVEGNSPVESMYILNNLEEIDQTIHTPRRQHLNPEKIDRIVKCLQ